MAARGAAKPLQHLWRCDVAMARLLRARRHEPGARRILAEGWVGRWPLSFLAAPQGLGRSVARLLQKPSYPKLCKPKLFFPFLTGKPVWPSNDAVSQALTSRWEEIREEFRAVMAESASADVNTKGLTARGSWQKVPLWSHGQPHTENLAKCPVTAEILAGLPLCKSLGMVYFSQLAPGTAVKPHFGPTNARLRYHLGLDVPEGNVMLAVADGYYRWAEGKTLVFNDAFIHAVHHEESTPRGVLVVDIYHPDLLEDERRLLEDLEKVHNSFFPAEYTRVLPH
ncbi:unnamed protein product [Polarella glacialis]|uniref:Aspartyl/asparaginy/proline hydroxylase domain-containing protein n=1 Tax=Polarella glacialis TaxID=89957 RepID=A0A813LG78_POLGL|nr:unnamed protein product [Polarella glacialis]